MLSLQHHLYDQPLNSCTVTYSDWMHKNTSFKMVLKLNQSSDKLTAVEGRQVIMTMPSSNLSRKRHFTEAFQHRQDDESSVSTTISTTSSSSKRQRLSTKKKSSVRFAADPHETHIVPRWSEEETKASWYSSQEYQVFRYQERIDGALLRTIIKAAPNVDTLPQDAAIYRGLERLLSSQIADEMLTRRKRCTLGVLLAQQRGFDSEAIARVSRNFSEKAAAWALKLGKI